MFYTADTIPIGAKAEILDLDFTEMGQRLSELGFWPGKYIELVVSAPFGDPMAFRLDNSLVALRKDEARNIRVRIAASAA